MSRVLYYGSKMKKKNVADRAISELRYSALKCVCNEGQVRITTSNHRYYRYSSIKRGGV